MWMTNFIREVQKNFVMMGFVARPDDPNIPAHVPDGVYKMLIEGKKYNIKVLAGKLHINES